MFRAATPRLVEAALDRIADGTTYGHCLRRDEEISMKRFRAMPHADFCATCEEDVDHGRSRKSSVLTELTRIT
jgi:RNA polymerase-binding transcription factor DksA